MILETIFKDKFFKLILFFTENPSSEFTQSNIRNKLKFSKATLIKWLNTLKNFNFISVRTIGRLKLYKFNKEDSMVKATKVFINSLTLRQYINKIRKKHPEINIYVYGSYARGEDLETSDIDILIIGKINKEDIINDIDEISKRLGKNINAKIFSSFEWIKMKEKDKAFYERVEKDKIGVL